MQLTLPVSHREIIRKVFLRLFVSIIISQSTYYNNEKLKKFRRSTRTRNIPLSTSGYLWARRHDSSKYVWCSLISTLSKSEEHSRILNFENIFKDDDLVDRLSYFYTSSFLIMMAVLVSFKQVILKRVINLKINLKISLEVVLLNVGYLLNLPLHGRPTPKCSAGKYIFCHK